MVWRETEPPSCRIPPPFFQQKRWRCAMPPAGPCLIGIGAVTDPLIALRMACLAVAEQKGPKP